MSGRARWSWWTLALGVGLGLGATLWLVRHVALDETLERLARFDAGRLGLLAGLAALNLGARTARWRHCFERSARPGSRAAFEALALGTAANSFLPARGGDLLRAALITRASRAVSLGLAVASLALEKLLDGIALVALAVGAATQLEPPGWFTKLVALAAAGFATALVVFLWIGRGRSPRSHPAAAGVTSRLRRAWIDFARGLAALRGPRRLASLSLATAIVWLTDLASVWIIGRGLGVELGLLGAACLTAVVGLGLMLPAAPAALGSYELLCVAALSLVGVAPEPGLAVGLALHAWTLAVTAAAAVIALAVAGLARLREARRAPSSAAPGRSGELPLP